MFNLRKIHRRYPPPLCADGILKLQARFSEGPLPDAALAATIRERFVAANFEVAAMRIDDLPFKQIGEGCDLSARTNDIPATTIETYTYTDKSHDGEAYEFKIHRLGKHNGKLWEIVTMHGNYEPHIHREADATFVMLRGRGHALLGQSVVAYDEWSNLGAKANVSHGFVTEDPTAFISIQSRPIVCTPAGKGEPHADFYPAGLPKLPDNVTALYNANRALAVVVPGGPQ